MRQTREILQSNRISISKTASLFEKAERRNVHRTHKLENLRTLKEANTNQKVCVDVTRKHDFNTYLMHFMQISKSSFLVAWFEKLTAHLFSLLNYAGREGRFFSIF